ncbi:DUF742 domain-containing protein [Nocardia aurea]|uniref:DUF742 domain-containing protein n=1 Tax=Nocardia aurea TaxID=2144174 RepID=UPI000D69DDCC|nr:DUF742 domain-containing protein [Nocardia aurea]
MTPARESWFEDDAGPLIRPYAVTGGHGGTVRHDLDMITLVVTVEHYRGVARMEPEHTNIVRMCTQAQSVAEVAAQLQLPLYVTKILISELIDRGYLTYRPPAPPQSDISRDRDLLQAVLNGIRKL